MRFRLGALIGLAIGFYLGAKAGRERYEQINSAMRRATSSDAINSATGTAKSTVNQGLERVKTVTRGRFGKAGGDDGSGSTSDAGEPTAASTATMGMTGPAGTTGAGGSGGFDPTNGQPLP